MSESVKSTETQKKEPSKGVQILKKVLNTVINVLIVFVLVVSVLIAVLALTSKATGISTIFGYTIQTIQSDSMKGGSPDGYPEGNFGKGDLMIAKATGGNTDVEYDVGDIVTFIEQDTDGNNAYIVHRIINKVAKDDGNYVYQTQGDNRTMSEVPDQRDVSEYLIKGQFVSVYYTASYKGTIIKGVGGFLDYLRTQQGFFFVVLLPMIAFFLYELVRVVMNATSYRKAKEDENKQAAVDAAIAEALSGKTGNGASDNMTDEEREQFKQFLAFKKMQEQQAEEQKANTRKDQPVEAEDEAVENTAEKTDNTPEE